MVPVMHKRLLLPVCLLIFSAGTSFGSQDWKDSSYGYFANNVPLETLLTDFSTQLTVPVVASNDASTLQVNGIFPRQSGLKFIENLCRQNGLAWFHDGFTIYVRQVNEVISNDIPIDKKSFDVEVFRNLHESFNVYGVFNKWQLIFNDRVLRVSGLPEYLNFINRLLYYTTGTETGSIVQSINVQSNNDDVIVNLTVKHTYDDQKLNDIADILARAMNVGRIALVAGNSKDSKPETPSLLSGLFGSGLSSKNEEPHVAEAKEREKKNASHSATAASDKQEEVRHFVSVNPHSRSIIVRDSRAKIPLYRDLLRQIDLPVEQVEISASIVDVNSNYTRNFGISLQSNQENGLVDYTYTPSTISAFGTFRATLTALLDKGHARIVSEPSVLTLNNKEAKFITDQTFYVRLQGDRAVDLIPINFGTKLQVVPTISGYKAGADPKDAKVHLAINIEDGIRSSVTSSVDAIPAVNNTTISTEAIVQNGYSLLIGGYQISNESKSRSGIPVLHRIPILGYLFSTRSKSITTITRYIIITVKILPYDNKAGVELQNKKALDAKNSGKELF